MHETFPLLQRRVWLMPLLALFLAACGGGAGNAISSAATAAIEPATLDSKSAAALLNSAIARTSEASSGTREVTTGVEVLQLEQLSATRFSRTQYDYTFAVYVKGGAANILNGELKVLSNAIQSQVIDGSSKFGSLQAGRIQKLADTITIRHDRTYAFERSSIAFTFAGHVNATTDENQINIGAVEFLEPAGRAGHQGHFLVRTGSPKAQSDTQLRAEIAGNVVAASYKTVNAGGEVLSSGSLVIDSASTNYYLAPLVVPSVPFRVLIQTRGVAGDGPSFSTDTYNPTAASIGLHLSRGVFAYGDKLTGIISVSGAPGTTKKISLFVPEGFISTQSSWRAVMPIGGKAEIPIEISTPKLGQHANFYNIVATNLESPDDVATIKVFAR